MSEKQARLEKPWVMPKECTWKEYVEVFVETLLTGNVDVTDYKAIEFFAKKFTFTYPPNFVNDEHTNAKIGSAGEIGAILLKIAITSFRVNPFEVLDPDHKNVPNIYKDYANFVTFRAFQVCVLRESAYYYQCHLKHASTIAADFVPDP